MSDDSETWLPVVGCEGLYEVSDLGRVRSLPHKTCRGMRGGKILKPWLGKDGYLCVGIYFPGNDKSTSVYIYRLVAASFLGPKPQGQEILHGPGGKSDNRLVNLSYGTHIENMEDRVRDGVGNARLTRTLAAEIRARHATGEGRRVLAREYGVSPKTIDHVTQGTRWRYTPAADLPRVPSST